MQRLMVLGFVASLGLLLPPSAHAFCGFYVAGADREMFNQATTVVMMREGTTTVLSMQNDYHGPPGDFAMVVPVPVVLHERNVRTLPREIFERVDRLAAPRLVEYWEMDPCDFGTIGLGSLGTIGHGGGGGAGRGYGGRAAAPPPVVVEAEFSVGEYDIVILSARESDALEAWLRDNAYHIPEGAAEVMRPYVAAGMKFFVARVNAARVRFEDDRAVLSPLRFHYTADEFGLPVRLGLLNSSGTQDLIVHVLARNQRYEVANYPNVQIPTNIDVADSVRARFGEFYAALFDRVLERNPGAVVTEYSWQATTCDPCPGPVLSNRDLATLGADVAPPTASSPPDPPVFGGYGRAASAGLGVPRIRAHLPDVEGDLGREVARRAVRRHLAEVRFCYERLVGRRPDAAGQVTIRFLVNATGQVTSSEAIAESLGDEEAVSCIAEATRRWSFPRQDGDATVTQRFELSVPGPTPGGGARASRYRSFVLTRMHYRYGRDGLGEDLVFRAADPINGGREATLGWGTPSGAFNTFQGRYVIRHAWTGDVSCDEPQRGRWGGPPSGGPRPPPSAAQDTARAPRGQVQLASFVSTPLEELGLGAAEVAAAEVEAAPPAEVEVASTAAPPPPETSGCGCRITRAESSPTAAFFFAVLAFAGWRRRRSGARAYPHAPA